MPTANITLISDHKTSSTNHHYHTWYISEEKDSENSLNYLLKNALPKNAVISKVYLRLQAKFKNDNILGTGMRMFLSSWLCPDNDKEYCSGDNILEEVQMPIDSSGIYPSDKLTNYVNPYYPFNIINTLQPKLSVYFRSDNIYSRTYYCENFEIAIVYEEVVCTVEFDANGGTCSKDSANINLNDTYGTLPVPTRDGYTFNGWFKASSGGTQVNSSETVTTDHTLYAQWTANSYSIEFDGNGAISDSMPLQSMTYDKSDNLRGNAYKRPGYTFLGWATSANAAKATYADKESVKNLAESGTVILYAVWSANSYSIEFDGNGATSGSMEYQVMTYDKSEDLTANAYKRLGYTFLGWAISENATRATYADKENVVNLAPSSTLTLYAVWKANTYSVAFKGNGATSGSMTPQTMTYDISDNLTANAYKRPGYTFLGWATSESATKAIYADQESVTNLAISGTRTLYAVWKANIYSVAFDGNGATSGSMASQAMTYDKSTSLTVNTYKRTGYTFLGWATSDSATEATYKNQDSVKNLGESGTVTLYAVWSANSYSIEFDGNGATSGAMASQAMTYDQLAFLKTNAYKRTGYTFLGWAVSATATKATYGNAEIVKNLAESGMVTLYAVWKANTYSIIFDGNGATSGSMTPQDMTYDESANLTANTYEKERFVFTGWATSASDTMPSYADQEIVINLATSGEVILYAVWNEKIYVIDADHPAAVHSDTHEDVTIYNFY